LYRCNGRVQNNIVADNHANGCGGLQECNGTIENNTIVGNSTRSFGSSAALEWCRGQILNCIVWGNINHELPVFPQVNESTTPTYCCIENWQGNGEGNIATNPVLVGGGDYHLLALASPCIDAGDWRAEYNDACLPPGSATDRNDMGAYGGPANGGWLEQPWLNTRPDQPMNLRPAHRAAFLPPTATLVSSAFHDADPADTHAASQWQVSTSGDFFHSPPLVWDSGPTAADLTSVTVTLQPLEDDETYVWRVRYQDSRGDWSFWSVPTVLQYHAPRPTRATNWSRYE
jgi:hypothetical protein